MKSPLISNIYTPPSTLSFFSEKDLFPESHNNSLNLFETNSSPTSFYQLSSHFDTNLGDEFSHLLGTSQKDEFSFNPYEITTMEALGTIPLVISPLSQEDLEKKVTPAEEDREFDTTMETPPQELEKKKSERKKIAPSTAQEGGREFMVDFKDPSLGDDFELSVKIKSLRGKSSELVPDVLYSSLKYDLTLEAKGEFVKTQPMLMARLSVVDPSPTDKLPNLGKAPINGEIEAALTHPPAGVGRVIKGCLKNVQFDSSISFNFVKKELSLSLSLFLHDDLVNPIYTIISYPVKFFARKPNKKKPKNEEKSPSINSKKRKAELIEDEEVQEPPKKESKSNFDEFTRRLNELFDYCGQRLTPEEKANAATLVLEKFGLSELFDTSLL